MENNFYVGTIIHKRKAFKAPYTEKTILYSEDNIYYIDLIHDNIYTTNISEKDFVLSETIYKTNIFDYRVDYMYLLSKYKYKNIKTKIKN